MSEIGFILCLWRVETGMRMNGGFNVAVGMANVFCICRDRMSPNFAL